MRNRERNRADAVAAFRGEMLAVMATLGGEFDSRIMELQELRKEIDAKQETSITLQQAVEIRDDALKQAASIKSQAANLLDNASEKMRVVVDKETYVKGEEERLRTLNARLTKQEADIKSRESTFQRNREEWDKIKADAMENISARSKAIEKREAELDKEIRETSDIRRKLDERLKALGSVA